MLEALTHSTVSPTLMVTGLGSNTSPSVISTVTVAGSSMGSVGAGSLEKQAGRRASDRRARRALIRVGGKGRGSSSPSPRAGEGARGRGAAGLVLVRGTPLPGPPPAAAGGGGNAHHPLHPRNVRALRRRSRPSPPRRGGRRSTCTSPPR